VYPAIVRPVLNLAAPTDPSWLPRALAGEPEGALEVGGVAPAFSLKGSDGKTYELAELKGKAVVVAWFPKAFTGG